MSFISVCKVELFKLWNKKTTLLLLTLLVTPLLFGIGMSMGLSFFVSDGGNSGVEAVDGNLSGLGFAINMMGQNNYILYLVVIILAAVSFAGELENGQMKSAILRISSRVKILLAKYLSLLLVVSIVFLLFIVVSLLMYLVFVAHTSYANGKLFDALCMTQLKYIFFQWLSVAAVISFTFLLGVRFNTFPCFAISYILWFASLYTDFMEKVKLLIPNNMPDYILESTGNTIATIPYAILYIGYCILLLAVTALLFQRKEIKA